MKPITFSSTQTLPVRLSETSEDLLAAIQCGLNRICYPAGPVDGLYGPKTADAWEDYRQDMHPGRVDMVTEASLVPMRSRLEQIDKIGELNPSNKGATVDAILRMCDILGLVLATQQAYVLATVEWETAETFKPVKEAFWLSEEWRKNNLRYYPYYGRGYVQITWKTNYRKYEDICLEPFVEEPDLVMQSINSNFILVHGFRTGAFTGKKLEDYVREGKTDYVDARRCINGRDKANEIARIASSWYRQLQ